MQVFNTITISFVCTHQLSFGYYLTYEYFRSHQVRGPSDAGAMQVLVEIVKGNKNSYSMRSWTTVHSTYTGALRIRKTAQKSRSGK